MEGNININTLHKQQHHQQQQRHELRYTEVLADHYDIDISSYAYRVTSMKPGAYESVLSAYERVDCGEFCGGDAFTASNSSSSSASGNLSPSGLVTDLPGFYWTDRHCDVHHTSLHSHALNDQVAYGSGNNNSSGGSISGSDAAGAARGSCFRTLSYLLPHIPAGGGRFTTVYHANKRFVTREHQPIEASGGATVPPSLLAIHASAVHNRSDYSDCARSASFQSSCHLHTLSFLVLSPIPDNSMPYNVITLVSTVLEVYYIG